MNDRPALPLPGAMSRERAAEYVGVSPNSFDELVRANVMPAPKTYAPVLKRIVWLREELDAALAELQTRQTEASIATLEDVDI